MAFHLGTVLVLLLCLALIGVLLTWNTQGGNRRRFWLCTVLGIGIMLVLIFMPAPAGAWCR
jgi:hypothetical protein